MPKSGFTGFRRWSENSRVKVRAVMSHPIVSVSPGDTIRRAAILMRSHDVGALPVIDRLEPVGIVTDRDLVVRALCGRPHEDAVTVGDVMSPGPVACDADQTVNEAAAIMGDEQIRRLLVTDRTGHPVGMLSVGDIAEHVSEELAGQALGEIVEARTRGTGGFMRPT